MSNKEPIVSPLTHFIQYIVGIRKWFRHCDSR